MSWRDQSAANFLATRSNPPRRGRGTAPARPAAPTPAGSDLAQMAIEANKITQLADRFPGDETVAMQARDAQNAVRYAWSPENTSDTARNEASGLLIRGGFVQNETAVPMFVGLTRQDAPPPGGGDPGSDLPGVHAPQDGMVDNPLVQRYSIGSAIAAAPATARGMWRGAFGPRGVARDMLRGFPGTQASRTSQELRDLIQHARGGASALLPAGEAAAEAAPAASFLSRMGTAARTAMPRVASATAAAGPYLRRIPAAAEAVRLAGPLARATGVTEAPVIGPMLGDIGMRRGPVSDEDVGAMIEGVALPAASMVIGRGRAGAIPVGYAARDLAEAGADMINPGWPSRVREGIGATARAAINNPGTTVRDAARAVWHEWLRGGNAADLRR